MQINGGCMNSNISTMYAQWRSLADYQNMRSNPAASPYFEQALQIAAFESGMYEVVRTFVPFQ